MAFLISVLVFIPNRNLVSDIQGKAGQLLSRGTGSAQQVGGAGGAYDNQQMIRVRFFYFFYLSFLLNPKNIVGIIFLWPIPKLIWEFNTRDFLAENWLTILMTKTWWRNTEFPKKDMLLTDLSLKWNGNLKPVFFKSLQTLNRVHIC